MAKRAAKKTEVIATAAAAEVPGKSDAVRILMKDSGLSRPKDIIAEAKQRWGLEIASSLVSSIKSKEGKGGGAKGKRGRPKGKRGPSAASTTPSRNGSGNIGSVVKACESLVGATGGVEQAKKALDAYSALAAL